jgi:hypothetical protein
MLCIKLYILLYNIQLCALQALFSWHLVQVILIPSLDCYMEKKWSDGEASTVLRYYCFYVIVLAMNGNSPCLLLLKFLFFKDIYHRL